MKDKPDSIASLMARCAGMPLHIIKQATEVQRNYDHQVIRIAQLTGNPTQAKAIAHGKKLQELEQIAFWLAEGHSLEDAMRYAVSN